MPIPAEARFWIARALGLWRRGWASLRHRDWRSTSYRLVEQLRAQPMQPRGAAPLPATELPDDTRPWILVVDDRMPTPDRDSGSLRMVGLLRVVRDAGLYPVFIADIESAPSAALDAIGIHQPAPGTWRIPKWLRANADRIRMVVLSRHLVAAHWLPLVRALAPDARIVFDTVDLHFLREQREAELLADPQLLRHANATRERELDLVRKADATWVVSDAERIVLKELVPTASVKVLSNIIDEDSPGLDFEHRSGLLFVGGLRHPPNRDAVEWLTREIFPRVRSHVGDVALHLVGGDYPAELTTRLNALPGVTCHGHVPDIAPMLDGIRIGVAPLRFGAGVKGKINLGLAHGQPVVATSCAIEGMHLQAGHDVLVADEADTFAERIAMLYTDPALWRSLAERGRENVRRHFSPNVAAQVLLDTIAEFRTEN